MSETMTKTPADLRAEADAADAHAAESFERCDTDGFLTQWASGLTARLKRAEADLVEAGGTAEFPALFDLDGNLVPAKLLPTKFGSSWALFDTAEEASRFNGRIVGWVGAFPKRASTMERKGFREGAVRVKAKAEIKGSGTGLSGAASCFVGLKRLDGGFSADAEIVDTGEEAK